MFRCVIQMEIWISKWVGCTLLRSAIVFHYRKPILIIFEILKTMALDMAISMAMAIDIAMYGEWVCESLGPMVSADRRA